MNKQTVQPRSDLRSVKAQFKFQEHCLFCGQPAEYDKKRRSADIFSVRTEKFKHVILDICSKRNGDWSQAVSGRLASINDLPDADAIYHQQCSSNFRTLNIYTKQRGPRWQCQKVKDWKTWRWVSTNILKVTHYLEDHGDEQKSINELISKMTENLDNTGYEPCSVKYMKQKLQAHFGDILNHILVMDRNVLLLFGIQQVSSYMNYANTNIVIILMEKS